MTRSIVFSTYIAQSNDQEFHSCEDKLNTANLPTVSYLFRLLLKMEMTALTSIAYSRQSTRDAMMNIAQPRNGVKIAISRTKGKISNWKYPSSKLRNIPSPNIMPYSVSAGMQARKYTKHIAKLITTNLSELSSIIQAYERK
ncbi:MAG: hypothetical protein ACTHJ0_03745 [Flavipsychrobacter sp.]